MLLQAESKLICIESDEDDHAAGSVPAREQELTPAGCGPRSLGGSSTAETFKVHITDSLRHRLIKSLCQCL